MCGKNILDQENMRRHKWEVLSDHSFKCVLSENYLTTISARKEKHKKYCIRMPMYALGVATSTTL